MQNEVKRRPVQQKPGDVTGWLMQGQKKQQLPGGRSAPPQHNATITPTRLPNTRSPLLAGRPARSQQAAPFSRQPGYKTASVVKNMAVPLNRRPAIAAKPGSTRRMPDNRFMAKESKPSFTRPSSPPAVSPVFLRTTYNTSPAQTRATAGATSGYRQPYVFNPAPDIPPKTPSGTGGNTLLNPGKIPDDMPNEQPCTCGQTGNGCTILFAFEFGSDELTDQHRAQVQLLAQTILENKMNVVTTTGHTDASGREENNLLLGRRRSRNVTQALKRALNDLVPDSPDALFWKTDTRGEAEPVSDTDEAANRRVVVCLKKIFMNLY